MQVSSHMCYVSTGTQGTLLSQYSSGLTLQKCHGSLFWSHYQMSYPQVLSGQLLLGITDSPRWLSTHSFMYMFFSYCIINGHITLIIIDQTLFIHIITHLNIVVCCTSTWITQAPSKLNTKAKGSRWASYSTVGHTHGTYSGDMLRVGM